MITGASGFVGGALARALSAAGETVVAVARRPASEHAVAPPFWDTRIASLADPNALAEAATGCEVVYHCAGADWHSCAPAALPWLHVAALENLVNAASHAGVKRLVLLSCADVTLRNDDRIHWKEQPAVTKAPLNRWCRTKLIGEEVALQQSSTIGVEVTAVRPAWLWGAGDRTRLPGLCREALSGGIRLWGSGENLFSAAHVDNVVHALRLASAADGAAGQAFHLTDGTYQTSGEFFGAMSAALGTRKPRRGLRSLAYGWTTLRALVGAPVPSPGDVIRRSRGCLLDIQRAVTDLHYEPQVSLDEGMRALAGWVKESGGVAALARLPARPVDDSVAAEFEGLVD